MRQSSVEAFNREWTKCLDAGVELERCFTRVADTMALLAGAGLHMHLSFPEPAQTWWVAWREAHGDLIPRHPEDAPLPQVEA